jgi:hypothetical protein
MKPETKKCQNCKREFTIEPDDFSYYEKIGVPEPKLCIDCRAQLRLAFKNERVFYKRPCDKCGKDKVSMYNPNKPYAIWCYDCWWSDDWDARDYGRPYDPDRPFLEQVNDLLKVVPKISLIYVRSLGSEYTNISADNKNCYMIVECSNNEDCVNCYWIQLSKDLVDSSFTNKVELSYEVDDCYDSSNLKWCKGCHSCLDSSFLIDCRGCSDCLGCINLRGQKYNIFNQLYSKEEYKNKLESFRLDTYSGVENFKKEFQNFIKNQPRKFAEVTQAINSTGNYMTNVKNNRRCFYSYDAEDNAYAVHVWRGAKDCMDVDTAGRGAELIYNSINSGIETARHISSNLCWSSTYAFYSTYCFNCNNVLGCVGLRKKDYCILNKEYDKETYKKLKEKIIAEMKEHGEWGNFFPPQMSPFGYNETPAQEHFPLIKEEALKQGFKWEDTERGIYDKETIDWKNFPDSIKDLPENFDVNKEIFKCTGCNKNYRVILNELSFYERMQIPIPRICPECRHAKRFKNRGPNKLWHRKCMNEGCNNEFETAYSPDRPEIVYCGSCYNKEVY